MKKTTSLTLALLLLLLPLMGMEAQSYKSPTEGRITHRFVPEVDMQHDLLQMLARFSTYMTQDWYVCQEPNSLGEKCGFFKGENSGGSDERGVRPNADLSMICAFLVKYAQPAGVQLPEGVSWMQLQQMARESLVFAYSTHKANRLKTCAGGRYWGSISRQDAVWESSLWAMSVAYSAFFQWDSLTPSQKEYIYRLLKAECQYELERDIPTGYKGDTKAEENGWEADVLAATLGLFPDDDLAPQWFERLREFAINSYSHPSDAYDHSVIDPHYDGKTVSQLYRGANLYDDFTLQNHNLFHTSYQNVVMQELGEAALALKLFQKQLHGHERWHTRALMHHNQEVQDSVLNWLALADGELAMPNGNDWSLFLFDQITSYTTQACFQRDPHALMLENMAYKYIKARQQTTADGSWLLRPDVGARRMGVQAHRVMMTWLMHHTLSTRRLRPTPWEAFNALHSQAHVLPCQQVIRASTPSRFVCFSWSEGLRSYTGYVTANSPDRNKIIVPYRAYNTGNFLGWYDIEGRPINARPHSYTYRLEGSAFVMHGDLHVNDSALDHRFVLYSTPGNALIYLDHVKALAEVRLREEKGGLMAISVDEFTSPTRTLCYGESSQAPLQFSSEGSEWKSFPAQWVCVDDQVGIVGHNPGKRMAFGDRAPHNSIYMAKLYPLYDYPNRQLRQGETVDRRNLVYYFGLSARETQRMASQLIPLGERLPEGWNGVVAADPDGTRYLLVTHFRGDAAARLEGIQVEGWAPLLGSLPTQVSGDRSSTLFVLPENESVAEPIRFWVKGCAVEMQLKEGKRDAVSIRPLEDGVLQIRRTHGKTRKLKLKKNKIVTFS